VFCNNAVISVLNCSIKSNKIIFSPNFDVNISQIIKHIWIIIQEYYKYINNINPNFDSNKIYELLVPDANFLIELININFIEEKQKKLKSIIDQNYIQSFREYIEYIMRYPGLLDINYQLLDELGAHILSINTFENFNKNKDQLKDLRGKQIEQLAQKLESLKKQLEGKNI
jgi:hypothetical protein